MNDIKKRFFLFLLNMNDIKKIFVLFLFLCIPTKLFLSYIFKKIKNKNIRLVTVLLIMGIVFLIIFYVSTEVVPSVDSSQCLFNDFYDSDRSVSGSKSPQQMARPNEGLEISNEWLSSVLNTKVLSHKVKLAPIGESGMTYIVTEIKYEDKRVDRKPSYVIKMHIDDPINRYFLTNFYMKEIAFYKDFALLLKDCEFEVPKVYAIFVDNTKTYNIFGSKNGTACFNFIMEDLNENWEPWSIMPGSSPNLQQHINSINALGSMHSMFMNNSELLSKPPFSYSGKQFIWTDWKFLGDIFPKCWPLVREKIPLLVGWIKKNDRGEVIEKKYDTKFGFPPEWDDIIELNELITNDPKIRVGLWKNLNKVLSSRPQTWVHSDYNPSNIWQHKRDKSKFCIADWQCMKMGPIGFDMIGAFFCSDAFQDDSGDNLYFILIENYYKKLKSRVSGIEEIYPLQHLKDDVLCCAHYFYMGLTVIISRQISADISLKFNNSPEKMKLIWEVFYKRYFNFMTTCDGIKFTKDLADGKYSNFGPNRFYQD